MNKIIAVLIFNFITFTAFALPPIKITEDKYIRIFYDTQLAGVQEYIIENHSSAYFSLKHSRIGIAGIYNNSWSFLFQTDYISEKPGTFLKDNRTEKGFIISDAQLRLDSSDAFNIYTGILPVSFARQNIESSFDQLNLDKSLFFNPPYKPERDIGVTVWGNLAYSQIGSRDNIALQYRFSVTSGRDKNTDQDPLPTRNFRYTWRFNLSFLDSETDYNYKGTYLGDKEVFSIGGAYQMQNNIIYKNRLDSKGEKNYRGYTFDFFYERPFNSGLYTLTGSYMEIKFKGAYDFSMNDFIKGKYLPNAEALGINGGRHGYYIKAGYMLPNSILQFTGRYQKIVYNALYNPMSKNLIFKQGVTEQAIGFNLYINEQELKLSGELSNLYLQYKDPGDKQYNNIKTYQLQLQGRF